VRREGSELAKCHDDMVVSSIFYQLFGQRGQESLVTILFLHRFFVVGVACLKGSQ
jgi:hypothetical protein